MSSIQETSIQQAPEVQPQKNEKEYNFSQVRRQLESERQARLDAERRAQELEKIVSSRSNTRDDEEESDEPYVDEKRLNKKLASFEKSIDQKIEERSEYKARMMMEEERRESYLKENHDFNIALSEENVEKFAQRHPGLAKTILKMPEGFDRQKLVYENIKALGIDKPEVKQTSIQDKIDANRRSPYYQPSGTSASPYSAVSDFSEAGKKNAYQKMMELKSRISF